MFVTSKGIIDGVIGDRFGGHNKEVGNLQKASKRL